MAREVVLITGASGGIGRAVVRELAPLGCRLVLHYHRNRETVERFQEELIAKGAEVFIVQGDLSSSKEVNRVYEEIESQWHTPDILIYTAGIAKTHLIQDLTDESWEEILGIGLTGAIYCARRNVPAMVGNQKGKIILFSSIWGMVGASCETAYSAVKAGIIGFSKALAKELGPSGIRVNCIAPGAVDTAMLSTYTTEEMALIAEDAALGYIASPEEIGKTVAFLVGEGGNYYTGQVFSPNGGMVI